MKAAAAIATGVDWQEALSAILEQTSLQLESSPVDLALLFASANYSPHYPKMLALARSRLGASVLIGCSGQGVIGRDREVEQEPAVSVLALSLPGVELRRLHVRQADIQEDEAASSWLQSTGITATDVNAWLLLSDPFSLDPERLLSVLSGAYPEAPLIGGLASGDARRRGTHLFLDDEVIEDGAIALALGGQYTVHTVVSQGAEPIGETWTITSASGNVVETLGMRPALEILEQTFRSLPYETQERARSNLLVGLAMNEYRDEFRRGDFLIRNLVGVDPERGAIAIGALPRVGQTLQFQLRDPEAADSELVELLQRAKAELGDRHPIGALLCACNGRGVGLFGAPNHDARTISEQLGPLPLAGFFCNGEIGPVSGKAYIHGFTASLAVIVPKSST